MQECEICKTQAQKTKQYMQKKKNETETIDSESTCKIREMMEDWSSVNFIHSLNFTTVNKKI